jgi:hypothetical protein
LASARRELVLFDAAESGLHAGPPLPGARKVRPLEANARLVLEFRDRFENALTPALILDPGPGLLIIDINACYARAAATDRDRIAGRPLFELLPDNPDNPGADGVRNLFASLRLAAQTRQPHRVERQRYDLRDSHGGFTERYWHMVNTPVLADDGEPACFLHQAEDITAQVLAARGGGAN